MVTVESNLYRVEKNDIKKIQALSVSEQKQHKSFLISEQFSSIQLKKRVALLTPLFPLRFVNENSKAGLVRETGPTY